MKKNKLADFANEYWRYDNITKKSEKQFSASYIKWAKKNGYHQNQDKALKSIAWQKLYPNDFLRQSNNQNAGAGSGQSAERVVDKAWVHFAMFGRNQQY